MQPITSYQSTVGELLRVVLQGPPKIGKSCVACQFPDAYIIDVDCNLGGPLRYLERNKLPLPLGYDVLDRDEAGVLVPMSARYARLDKLLVAAQANPDIKTIVLDSATNLTEVIIAEVMRQQMKTTMSKQLWGFFYNTSKNLIATLTQMRKHIVLTAHEKQNTTEEGATIYPYEVNWPGQFGKNIGAFFTDVWRCEVDEIPKGMETSYKWWIRTMPNHKFKLGNSLDLPARFEFKWETIAEKLKK